MEGIARPSISNQRMLGIYTNSGAATLNAATRKQEAELKNQMKKTQPREYWGSMTDSTVTPYQGKLSPDELGLGWSTVNLNRFLIPHE